jgi:hypothetical protein
MRSRDNSIRAWLEAGLHGVAVVLLAGCLIAAWRERSRGGPAERATSASLEAALKRWSTVAVPTGVEIGFDRPPTVVERDWLAALPGASTRVRWSGRNLVVSALALLPVVDPRGGVDLLVTAPGGTAVTAGAGQHDSARSEHGSVRLYLPGAGTASEVNVGGMATHPTLRDSLIRRKILVLGAAGWEAKFAIAALEERGWDVDAHLAVAPHGDVAQGVPAAAGATEAPAAAPASSPTPVSPVMPRDGRITFSDRVQTLTAGSAPVPVAPTKPMVIDTSRYAAILAVDSIAAREATRVVKFVRDGGGLLLWPGAASAFAAVAPGRNAPASADVMRHAAGPVTLDSLLLRPVIDLTPEAVALVTHGAAILVASRRVGPGRVVQLGVEETWRWRMAGDASAMDAHRDWLARLVAGIAYAPRIALGTPPGDVAPYAALVDKLGAPAPPSAALTAAVAGMLNGWTFAVLCGALLAEWLSRRLRSRP